MNPEEAGLPAHYHFRFRPDLPEEMCLEDCFLRRPKTVEEAMRLGIGYPKQFDRDHPLESAARILGSYTGLPKRILFSCCSWKSRPEPNCFIYLGGAYNLHTNTELFGPYQMLFDRAKALIEKNGTPRGCLDAYSIQSGPDPTT